MDIGRQTNGSSDATRLRMGHFVPVPVLPFVPLRISVSAPV